MQLLPILTAVAEQSIPGRPATWPVSYTHLRAHETD